MTFWKAVVDELSQGWPNNEAAARVIVRLIAALALASVIGWEREAGNKTAGLRTHLLVALGCCLFVLVTVEAIEPQQDVTRVIQGLAAGIGFIGAGAIIKGDTQGQVRGLTTSGSIWMVAAIGVACGLGKLATATLAVILTWIVLVVLENLKQKLDRKRKIQPKIHYQPPG